jgi:hypothetical protein
LGWALIAIAVIGVVVTIAALATKSPSKHKPSSPVAVAGASSIFSAAPLSAAPTDTAAGLVPAHVGDTITVKDDSGKDISLTLVKVKTTAHATDGISTPDPGNRYFAALIRINPSPASQGYDDAPDNGAVAIDSHDQRYDPDIVESIDAGPMFPTPLKIAPGQAAQGWIVFQVPVHAVITGVQFSLSSGFGNAAQWIVP